MENAACLGKPCCAPGSQKSAPPVTELPEVFIEREPRHQTLARMTRLDGGNFLMGTDYAEGFPDDGEGPVHAVTLDPFFIDTAPVTNEIFSRLIRATGYRTEAERFGWSFVF